MCVCVCVNVCVCESEEEREGDVWHVASWLIGYLAKGVDILLLFPHNTNTQKYLLLSKM